MNTASSDRFARLRETPVFRNGGFDRWAHARLLVIGGGTVGSRFAIEAVRSGVGRVCVCDFELAEEHNLATQVVRPGIPKVCGIVSDCDALRPGAATGIHGDIRHVGPGLLRRFDALIDTSDDPRLAYPLTEIGNGLGIPLLRAAVDGSGRTDSGRVLCSDARDAGACQVCTYSQADLGAGINRTPCPGASTAVRPPTRAGNALAGIIAGVALLQAQRLISGNELELVRNREVIVDLTHLQIMGASLRRSEQCLSGHTTWNPIDVPACEIESLADVYAAAERVAGGDAFRLQPYGHPFCLEAQCVCGAVQLSIGTQWAVPPICDQCAQAMSWRTDIQIAAIERRQADALGILPRTLTQLGLPDQGAMFVLRFSNRPALQLIVSDEIVSN